MQPLSFFLDDTMPLRFPEENSQFFLLHGGTAALKERLLQTIATAQPNSMQEQFYRNQFLCGLFFPEQNQIFLDADVLTLLPEFRCPELDTHHIALSSCYHRPTLQTHMEAIRYSDTALRENQNQALLLQAATEQAFSHFCARTEAAVCPERFPTLRIPLSKQKKMGSLQIRQLQDCTPEGFLMQPLPSDWNNILLIDPWYTAGSLLLEQISMIGVQNGLETILCLHPLHPEPFPAQVLFPEQKQAYLLQGMLFDEHFSGESKYSLQDCYQKSILSAQAVPLQLAAAQLHHRKKAYIGRLQVAQGIRTVLYQYYQAAERPMEIQNLSARLLCACNMPK